MVYLKFHLTPTDMSDSASSFDYTGPINPNPGPDEASITIYGYVPTLSFALVAAITFGLLLVAQGVHAIRWKGYYRTFHILLFIGLVSLLTRSY